MKHFRVHFVKPCGNGTGIPRHLDIRAASKDVAESRCRGLFVDAVIGTTKERNRFRDAHAIQMGACNPIAVANSLVEAIAQCNAEGMGTDAINSDPAVQLIVHQLAHLTGTQYWSQAQYERAVAALTEKMQ